MRRTSNNNRGEALGNWFVRYARIIMPVVLAICVIVTIVIAVRANKKETESQEDVEANITLEEIEDETLAVVPQVALKENDNPEIEELINNYYAALAAGDIDTIRTLMDYIDDTEILRIEETSKYIESYPKLDIYTKDGPTENTYLAYICTETKFTDYENPIPGMRVWYICADENGKYYINENGAEDEAKLNYIREVSLQDDVVDLNNKVTVAYNDMLASDVDLAQFILDVNEEIEKNVGALQAQAQTNSESEEGAESADTEAEGTEGSGAVVTKVKATDVVNIRSSDSETADKIGKAAIGDEFKLIEKIGNGWSKIEYEGKDAYIKSEYLEDIETTELAANDTEETTTDEQETAANTSQSSNETTNGTVTVTQSVKIRSSASTDSSALGTAYVGDKLELIMKQADGWTRVKYNGKTAFVKSEYVE